MFFTNDKKKKMNAWTLLIVLALVGFPFAAVALAFMIASTVYTAATSIQQSKQQAKAAQQQADYNAQLAKQRAEQARIEAQWADYRIAVEKQKAAIEKRKVAEEGLRDIARSKLHKGIMSSSGSILQEVEYSLDELTYDLELIDWESDLETSTIQREKTSYLYSGDIQDHEADRFRWEGGELASMSRAQGLKTAGGSLLTGGAAAFSFASDNMSALKAGK